MNRQFFVLFFTVFLSLLAMFVGMLLALIALNTNTLTKLQRAWALTFSLLMMSGSVVGTLIAICECKAMLGAI